MSRFPWGLLAIALATILFGAAASQAAESDRDICDVAADTALGVENYPSAIALHRNLVKARPNNALAHYHLGYAYGIERRPAEEIEEYRTAVRLGLRQWDLFLNLGLAYFSRHDLPNATVAFETATLLGRDHSETHLNLAIAYEREHRMRDALREIGIARWLAPEDPDIANTDALICAEMGNLACARKLWSQLAQTNPAYYPARANLAILTRSSVSGPPR